MTEDPCLSPCGDFTVVLICNVDVNITIVLRMTELVHSSEMRVGAVYNLITGEILSGVRVVALIIQKISMKVINIVLVVSV